MAIPEFDYTASLAKMAAMPRPESADPVAAAQGFNGGYTLKVCPTEPIDRVIPGVQFVDSPENADTVLVIHRADAPATA